MYNKNKRPAVTCKAFLVGEDGFEPSKLKATDLQSAPFGRSGILPFIHPEYFPNEYNWSWWTDLNPRPADYKSAALPTELHQLIIISGIPWRRLSPDDLIIIPQIFLNVKRFFECFQIVHISSKSLKSRRQDSNLRHLAPKASTLPN